jgi:hypothetical protein
MLKTPEQVYFGDPVVIAGPEAGFEGGEVEVAAFAAEVVSAGGVQVVGAVGHNIFGVAVHPHHSEGNHWVNGAHVDVFGQGDSRSPVNGTLRSVTGSAYASLTGLPPVG